MSMVVYNNQGGEEGNPFAGALTEFSQWLWSRPLGNPGAEDVEEEAIAAQEELEFPEDEAQARHSCLQRTTSWATPKEVSPSGRVYQTVRLSRMEYSRPTMSIRSQASYFSSSARPLPPPPAPSLMSWTPIAKYHPSSPTSTSSKLRRAAPKLIKRG
uniref:Movement protein P17 n=1 Tax=Potato leafroll virus TaxID=12045 RepID=MVP_PLRV|nr:RecName: Full=Movement protein P17; Short=MP; AltName: Full=17 kDa protein; AltName: Full=MP17 [Potato leafroll virus]CAA32107.1 unnamed protein product [Potato leafroll virus]